VPAQCVALRWWLPLVVGAIVFLWIAAPAAGALETNVMCLGAPTTVEGTPGDDVIHGTPGADVVAAFGGSDLIRGRASADRLCGGRGSDVLLDGMGSDLIDGGDGVDLLYLCPDGAIDRWTGVEHVAVSSRACI
jgi:Ca2+-binding RTX toxin-like protein